MFFENIRSCLIAAMLVCNVCVEGLNDTYQRDVPLGIVDEFVQFCTENNSHFPFRGEWKEVETKVSYFDSNLVDPQVFRYKNGAVSGGYVVKASKEYGVRELLAARDLLAKLKVGNYDKNRMDFIVPEYYAIYRDGKLVQINSVLDFKKSDVRRGDWVLSLMKKAHGVQYGNLHPDMYPLAYKSLGECVKCMSKMGIVHGDLHSGNIFFS